MTDRWNAFVDRDPAAIAGPGPLSGVTMGVKSNIAVKGLPHTGGMAHRRGMLAGDDAAVVAALRSAGAVILGSLNMHEAALGATTDNLFYGRTHNPHRHGHTPGGSSGGSGAAVAAGLCDLALGTDTLGSVRIPAAYCGVYGLKPGHGAVNTAGMLFLDARFDGIGPLARSLDMLERGWDVIKTTPSPRRKPGPIAGNQAMGPGFRRGDRAEAGNFTRFLTLHNLADTPCEPGVLAGYAAAITALPAKPTEITLPFPLAAIRTTALASAGRALIADLGANRALASPELQSILTAIEAIPENPALLAATKAALIDALGDDGVLLMPTTPQAAFAHGTRAPANQADFTALANVAGLPALAMPSGIANGLPVSVQLMGPAGSETALIALAKQLDSALNAYQSPGET